MRALVNLISKYTNTALLLMTADLMETIVNQFSHHFIYLISGSDANPRRRSECVYNSPEQVERQPASHLKKYGGRDSWVKALQVISALHLQK